jgi:hypothetical protein
MAITYQQSAASGKFICNWFRLSIGRLRIVSDVASARKAVQWTQSRRFPYRMFVLYGSTTNANGSLLMKFAFIQKRQGDCIPLVSNIYNGRCLANVNSIKLMPDQIQPNITKDNECPGVWYTQRSGKNYTLRNGVWFRDRCTLRKVRGSGSRNVHRIIRKSPGN